MLVMKISSKCIVCKGRDPDRYCGRQQCPIILKSQALMKVKELSVGSDFSADSPSVFVGRHGYPKVNVGLLTPLRKRKIPGYMMLQRHGLLEDLILVMLLVTEAA